MRILFISSWFPYPPDNGSRIRIFNLLRHLARRHEIILLCFSKHPRDLQYIGELESLCERVHVVEGREFQPQSMRAVRGFLHPWPRWLVDTYNPIMAQWIEHICSEEDLDLAIASQIDNSPYLQLIQGIPRVLEELEVSLDIEAFRGAKGIAQTLRQGLRLWKLARYLQGILLQDAEGCTVVSDLERQRVLRLVPRIPPPALVPNGVDVDHYAGDFGEPDLKTLIFTGVLSYSANFDALDYFLREIWSLIQQVEAEAKLFVTGRTEGVPLERLPKHNSVIFTGYVEDIRPWIAQSCVSIVPIRMGGGTRLKILESMALGTPVVSTSKGAEGLAVKSGEHLLIADEPAPFAEAVLSLMKDNGLRSRLSISGKSLVRARYDWQSIASDLEAYLCEVVSQAGTEIHPLSASALSRGDLM